MGKITNILSAEEIVTNSINTYIKDSTETYPNFLESAPFFVTYYSRSAYQSTFDVSLENYNEVVGEESPNKFHKVEKLPVYSLDTSDFSQEMGDEGWKGEISSSCIILPNTVVPKPDDLIEIEIHSKKYLFQVTNGTSDNYGNTKFYKINFRISNYTSDEANRQITEEFEVDFELIGKAQNVLIKKKYVSALTEIENTYDSFLKAFIHQYFNKSSQSFILSEMGIIDQYLNYFIDDNNLNKPYLEFRNSCIISPLIKQYLHMGSYKKTFYTLISEDKIKAFDELRMFVFPEFRRNTQYKFTYFLKNKYNFVFYDKLQASSLGISNLPIVRKAPEDILLEDDRNLIFIQKYIELISASNSENSHKRLDEIIQLLPTLSITYTDFNIELEDNVTIFNYYSIPLILFSLKKLHSLITEV